MVPGPQSAKKNLKNAGFSPFEAGYPSRFLLIEGAALAAGLMTAGRTAPGAARDRQGDEDKRNRPEYPPSKSVGRRSSTESEILTDVWPVARPKIVKRKP